MGIRYLKKSASLQGQVGAEDAEILLEWLKSRPGSAVNVGRCQQMHAAVLQVLLALRPRITGRPEDPWLQAVLSGPHPSGPDPLTDRASTEHSDETCLPGR
jgi:hypothetical protein